MHTTNTRPCTRCKGTAVLPGWTASNGNRYPDRPCYACRGEGAFPPPDWHAILDLLTVVRGPRKGGLRAARPAYAPPGSSLAVAATHSRAYYVWRLARFHGGRDVTLPVCASMDIAGDPFADDLDAAADAVAKAAFGTHMAGAARWGSALGLLDPAALPAGLPAAAYPCGPVADGHKPAEEMAELC